MNSTNPRALALKILLELEQQGSSHAVLDQHLSASDLDSRDRGLVTALVDGVLRWQARLDYIAERLINRPVSGLDMPIRIILRLGIFQMTLLERIPAHAAINESVELARANGHEGPAKLVNAVLRRLQREPEITFPNIKNDPVAHLSTFYSHPAWLVERWLPRFGISGTEDLLRVNNTPPPLTIRANRRWITRDGLWDILDMHGVETVPTAISPMGLIVTSGGDVRATEEYREGLFTIQGEGSMVMVELMRIGKNRAGWDMAAGVGGKTTYLAERADDTGSILATDTSEDRLQVLREQLQRLDLHCVTVHPGDARTAPVEPESMDFILLDAPCSGTGALRRQADARWKKTPAQIEELTILQRELLNTAARATKPGGILLYCTCSLEPEENEGVVEPFLAENPEWTLDPAEIKHKTLPPDALDAKGFVHLLPHHHRTDGFFAARLRRKMGTVPSTSA